MARLGEQAMRAHQEGIHMVLMRCECVVAPTWYGDCIWAASWDRLGQAGTDWTGWIGLGAEESQSERSRQD